MRHRAAELVSFATATAARTTVGQRWAIGRFVGLTIAYVAATRGERAGLRVSEFDVVFWLAAAYAFASAVVAFGLRRELPEPGLAALDLLGLTALAATSGGALAEVRGGFWLVPLLASVRVAPKWTAIWGALAGAGYVTAAVVYAASHDTGGPESAVGPLLYLTAVTAIAIGLSRRQQRLATLARRQTVLVGDSLQAESRERRRLAEALHDVALQNLLTLRQDLEHAEGGGKLDAAATRHTIEATIDELRTVVGGLHPQVLSHAGLEAALRVLAARHDARGQFTTEVSVDPSAVGRHDELLVMLAREALTNVAKHSGATEARVTVAREDDLIVLEVVDNGRGFAWDARRHAIAEGHIGLASSAARVGGFGGKLTVHQRPGGGAIVRFAVPERLTADEQLHRSEELLRTLVDSIEEYAIYTLDPGGHITSWNSGAERITGYRPDEILGAHFSRFYDPADAEGAQPARALRIALTRGSFDEEGWRVRKDGSRFWASVVVSRLESPDGRHLGYAKVTRDLSERRRGEAQAALQAEIAAHMSEGVVLIQASSGAILYANRAFETMFGYGPGQLVGMPMALHSGTRETSERISAEIQAALESDGIWRGEVRNVRADGTTFWSWVNVSILAHPEYGKSWLCVHADVAQRKRAELERRTGRASEGSPA
jgi:two-component system NarL family sensor kinase